MPTLSIPTNPSIGVKKGGHFDLKFEHPGIFRHNDPTGVKVRPILPTGRVNAGTTAYQATGVGTVTCEFDRVRKAGEENILSMHTITIGDRAAEKERVTIHIPDGQLNHPIHFVDEVFFHFDEDDKVLKLSDPSVFKQAIPPGPYKKGSTIGPFNPAKHKTSVTFTYDNSLLHGMHTITIGD